MSSIKKKINKQNSFKWIRMPGPVLRHEPTAFHPAPFFRKTFSLSEKQLAAEVKISGLGYYELYINGAKVGDHVLDPVVTHYDKRVSYITYDVSEYLHEGGNVIGVILGNGWYNCHTSDLWHFEDVAWRDYPKLLLQMSINGEDVLSSDASWQVTTGPIVFDGLRNGETYDARLELKGWLNPDYDDSGWSNAAIAVPPGGILCEQLMPPCKVMDTLNAVDNWEISNVIVFDIGQNITGWSRISVEGDAGTELIIRYGEILDSKCKLDQEHISRFIQSGDTQTDHYILKGEGLEQWEPRFTYHGFQYVQIEINGKARIEKVEGRVVHTSFDKIGKFICSDDVLNRLQECTVWSYIDNFTGIPTDCPHREKNGWTGDAHLAAETGLFNFDASSSYIHWIDNMVDAQRPSGQLPVMIPTSNWGYNRNGGPAWDSALLLIPWYIYIFTGDKTLIERHYQAMKRYVDYCSMMAQDFLVDSSLGDWCHADPSRMVATALSATAYYYTDSILLAKFAKLSNNDDDYCYYSELASEIKDAFNCNFYNGNGIYAKGEQTAMACALFHGLVEPSEKSLTIQRLAESVQNNECKADFGILGAKYIPRVLAENGYAELAYKIITQPEFPGWGNWLKKGATTLWEHWDGKSSINHIMFGDISAWMYQYIAGIIPDPDAPGFKHFFIRPHRLNDMTWAKAEYHCRYGKIISFWQYKSNTFILDVEIPQNCSATLLLPSGQEYKVKAGMHNFIDIKE